VPLGDLGGGSDFAGFYNHLGIPSAGFGFGGPYGVYHSAYDSFDWMRRFGDTSFVAHAAAGSLAALFMARLANADLVPFDYVAFTAHLRNQVATLADSARAGHLTAPQRATLARALNRLGASATRWAHARDAARGTAPTPETLAAANRELRGVERALTRPEGLRERSWMRNLVFAADRDNGYATVALPSISEALTDGDAALVAREVADLAARIDAAAAALVRATRVLTLRG
jgi:N-acetylated-alpha-linked acidic dipeptidase